MLWRVIFVFEAADLLLWESTILFKLPMQEKQKSKEKKLGHGTEMIKYSSGYTLPSEHKAKEVPVKLNGPEITSLHRNTLSGDLHKKATHKILFLGTYLPVSLPFIVYAQGGTSKKKFGWFFL